MSLLKWFEFWWFPISFFVLIAIIVIAGTILPSDPYWVWVENLKPKQRRKWENDQAKNGPMPGPPM